MAKGAIQKSQHYTTPGVSVAQFFPATPKQAYCSPSAKQTSNLAFIFRFKGVSRVIRLLKTQCMVLLSKSATVEYYAHLMVMGSSSSWALPRPAAIFPASQLCERLSQPLLTLRSYFLVCKTGKRYCTRWWGAYFNHAKGLAQPWHSGKCPFALASMSHFNLRQDNMKWQGCLQ